MAENMKPLSLREGHAYIDGEEVIDSIKLKIVFKPDVWEGKVLSDPGTNRRYIGYDVTGEFGEYRTTPRFLNIVKQYLDNGITPEFTIQGTRTDKDSDFYDISGSESVTVSGAVFTGDINLLELDTEGDVAKDSIEFGAKKVVY